MEWKNLDYEEVAGMQIIKALNKNLGEDYTEGEVYKRQQTVANEARRRGLLINPNPYGRTECGCTGDMEPSAVGWEQTKGIQMRVHGDAFVGDVLKKDETTNTRVQRHHESGPSRRNT